MNSSRFILNAEECELLIAFETAKGVEDLASVIGRDVSNISRSLTKIASKLPVIEKSGRRWVLTGQGRALVQQAKDSIEFQRSLFQKQSWLRVGTNREFSARVIAAKFDSLQKLFPNTQLRLSAFETGVEEALLGGLVDIGIDCDRPFNPEIAYKTVLPEPIAVVGSPSFKKKYGKELKSENIFSLPHLLCDRLRPDRILSKSEDQLNVLASFNDIATTREVCIQGHGWALLPKYAVQRELDNEELVELVSDIKGKSTYGVWWLRGRKYLGPHALSFQNWMRRLEL